MPNLMSLPNEILISIIDATGPEDVLSFSTCSKRMYSLASRRLKEHKEKKRLFSKILVNSNFQPFPRPLRGRNYPNHNIDLKEFFSDERNRLYPKAMVVLFDFAEFGPTYRPDSGRAARISAIDVNDEFERQLKPRMAEVHNMIALVVGEIEAAEWDEDVKAGYPLALFLLLLALLPNLEECEIQTWGDWPRTSSANYSKIIRVMIEAGLGQKKDGLGCSGRLTKCTVEGDYCRSIGESFLPFIMMLPRMQTVKGNSLHIEDGSWPFTDAVSPVVDLGLNGVIHTATLSNYVRGIREFKRFQYDFTDKRIPHIEPHGDCEPCGIVDSLRQYAFRSLVSLDLTSDQSYEMYWFDISPGIGSLRSFEVLENVRLHYVLVLEEVLVVDGADEDDSAETSETLDEAKGQQLIDFLPSSVKIFHLEDIPEVGHILDTFVGFPEHKVERLPNLESISLDADDKTISRIEDICKETGVRINQVEIR